MQLVTVLGLELILACLHHVIHGMGLTLAELLAIILGLSRHLELTLRLAVHLGQTLNV
jgi:hypothetical protein